MKLHHFHEYLEKAVAHRGTIAIPIEMTRLWAQHWFPAHGAMGELRFLIRDQIYDDLYAERINEEVKNKAPSVKIVPIGD